MKQFLSKFFDLRSFDGFNLAAFFLIFAVYTIMDLTIPDQYYTAVLIISVGANLAIIIRDRKVLQENGISNPPNILWCMLIPAYIFRRERVAGKKNYNVAWAYLVILAVYMFASFHIDTARDPERVATDVCPIVDTIDIYRDANITCVRAYNFSEQYEGFWKGRVHLSNNMVVGVTADYNQKEGSVYVQTTGVSDAGY